MASSPYRIQYMMNSWANFVELYLCTKLLDVDYNYLATTRKIRTLMTQQSTLPNATMPEIQALMTFFLQGEKFCGGFWGNMIETGLCSSAA